MIVGHLGVAATVARARPRLSLWWLLPAAIAPDLVDVAYALAGICNPYGLYSHTIPAAVLIGACIGAAAVLAGRRETAAVALLLVMLHLPLDFFTGRKLYWPGGELYGLMWYDRPTLDFLVESAIAAAGWMVLRTAAGAPRWTRSGWALLTMVALQGSVDLLHDGSLKPSACLAAAPRPR